MATDRTQYAGLKTVVGADFALLLAQQGYGNRTSIYAFVCFLEVEADAQGEPFALGIVGFPLLLGATSAAESPEP